MSEQPPPEVAPPSGDDTNSRRNRHAPPPEPELMPRWVPILIGVVLVTLGILAVVTGMRYRDNTLVRMVTKKRAPAPVRTAPAPPGEPEAGASLVVPGQAGDSIPGANAPVTGNARAEITGGGAAGVTSVVRMWARRGMIVKAEPPDALVYVNDMPIGHASQFDSEDEIYDFASEGSYTIRVVAPGFAERQYVVTAGGDAKEDVATIDAKLAAQ